MFFIRMALSQLLPIVKAYDKILLVLKAPILFNYRQPNVSEEGFLF